MVADPPPSCAEVAARATDGLARGIQGCSIPLIPLSALARDMSSKRSITDRVKPRRI